MSESVSKESELALRDAMARLLGGVSRAEDDTLTISNLAREAGVSRATANRAKAVLAEFGAAVENARIHEREIIVARKEARISALDRKLKTRNAENAELRERCGLYAQEIQYLNLRLEGLERVIRRHEKTQDGPNLNSSW